MQDLTLVIGNKNYSSWSLRAWFLLKEMGLEFDEILLKLFTDEFEQGIGKYSPSKQVPVLKDKQHIIWDSLSIAEYLNEQYPDKQNWPKDSSARILARSLAAEMHSGFFTLRSQMPMNCRAENRNIKMTDDLQTDIDRIIHIWNECRNLYATQGPWLFGEFSVADAMYAPVAFRFASYSVNVVDEARTYMDFLLSRPAMQQWKQDAIAEKEVIEAAELGLSDT